MEIHFIRRLCRPEKYISPRKCGICAPKAHKLCAQSRRSPFCQESVSFFDSPNRCRITGSGFHISGRVAAAKQGSSYYCIKKTTDSAGGFDFFRCFLLQIPVWVKAEN